MRQLRNLCVFCGASSPSDERYAREMHALGDEMLARKIGLVYGGGRVGLMGVVAEKVLFGGGFVLGVIPHQLQRREVAHLGVSELIVVDSMHERKAIMYDRSDAFIVMPGGFGTLDEAMEILTWKQLGIHDKPIVFVNVAGYYDGLEAFFRRAIVDGLLKAEYAPLYHFVDGVAGLFAYLDGYEPAKTGIMPWA
jgi:uncharacterized protein (TIGR00730 family)